MECSSVDLPKYALLLAARPLVKVSSQAGSRVALLPWFGQNDALEDHETVNLFFSMPEDSFAIAERPDMDVEYPI